MTRLGTTPVVGLIGGVAIGAAAVVEARGGVDAGSFAFTEPFFAAGVFAAAAFFAGLGGI